ncbi:Cilia- and flagella-associated protein 44 [Phlyctochytrium planicorne]|nr:Cilia- and flagella-associated protein 44 [Phlyctochytrium planicorne]
MPGTEPPQAEVATKTEGSQQAQAPQAIPEDFYYDYEAFWETDVSGKNMRKDALTLFCSFGFDSHKRSNIYYLDEFTILSAVGNILVFLNSKTMEQAYFHGLRPGAIGAVAIHPSRKYIALGEVYHTAPCIFLFEYPSMKLFRVLKGGAVRGFSDLAFNSTGDKLASLGSDPDYMLTLWDWKNETVILRSKAFSQDVFKVAFAPETDGNLTTAGMGHIKFWKMAATFTGLKLQGYIGKFGASELTDISAFIQLADGKVLSSTETGNMLLWDGGIIKCELALKGKKPCHQGKIEVVMLIEGEVFTAGEDGYVRVWDLETIDNADVTTVSAPSDSQSGPASSSAPPQARVFELEALEEFLIGKDVKIKNMIKCPGDNSEYLIQDLQGNLFKLDTKKRASERILSFHSGAIAAIDTSPLAHSLMSLGSDGTLRLYDYLTKSMVLKGKYPNSGCCLQYLPESIDSKGCTVAAGFSDGVLRIISHTPISLSGSIGDFTLHFVFKPHRHPITAISISQDGTYMATASSDKTVFFFRIETVAPKSDFSDGDAPPPVIFSRRNILIRPLGFLEFKSPVVSLTFSPDNHMNISEIEPKEKNSREKEGEDSYEDELEEIEGKRTLIVTKDGEIFSLIAPSLAQVDTRSSFQLSPRALHLKSWTLDVPPPKATPAAGTAKATEESKETKDSQEKKLENKKDSEDSKKNQTRMTSALRRARGLVITSKSPATAVMYLEGGYFLLALTNTYGEGEIRSCKFGLPSASRLILVHKAPFTDVRLSASGKHVLVGSVDGMSCLRKIRLEDMLLFKWEFGHETYEHYSKAFEEELGLKKAHRDAVTHYVSEEEEELVRQKEDEGLQWIGFSHDCDRGRVSSVVTTFDDSFLCSAANDGGLFVWRNQVEPIRRSEAFEGDSEDALDVNADDIVDTNVYTIQEEKLKAEKDRELNDAENKRQLTKELIEELRVEFNRTVAELEKTFPEQVQGLKKTVEVDPNLRKDIDFDTEVKIQTVKKELEWISEKESIGPNKLKRKFFDDLGTEYIEITAFKTKHFVSTFRTTNLEQSLESVLNPLVHSDKSQAKAAQTGAAKDQGAGQGKKAKLQVEQEEKKEDSSKRLHKQNDARSKLEARKALRLERSALWKELMDSKPDDSYEDSRDVAAIRYAELHMGDYKLKTGEKYIVPESERVDADKKKRQILMLKQSVYSIRESFNRRVLRLRQRKRELVEKFRDQNKQILSISERLKEFGEYSKDDLWSPDLEGKAFPELRYTVTNEDIAKLQQEEAEAASKAKGGGDTLGGFSSAPVANNNSQTTAAPPGKDSPAPSSRPGSSTTNAAKPATSSVSKTTTFEAANRSNLEIAEIENTKKILKHQKELILKEVQDGANQFDAEIENLSKERVALESDIKFADIKLLLLYREWILLKEFEKHDNALAEKLIMKKNEKAEIDAKIKECQEKLIAKKLEIEEVIQKEKANQDEFQRLLGENNKHEDYLSKVFKKKIKRAKKKGKGADGNPDQGDNEEEEEEQEDEDEDDMDDSDGSDGSNSVSSDSEADGGEECPPDCDPAIFAAVQELREKKLDQEDILAEIQKVIETLKKENDGLIKKEKIIDMALRNTEAEIQDFQTQKQQKLNELDVVVPLRLHQVQLLEKNAIPQDLSQALVFVNDGLIKLKSRIKELQQEKSDIRKQHKELRKMHVSLIKSRKEKQLKLSELEMRATDVQMLKFGKIIDLEKLERMGVNKNADELREKLQKEDNKRSKEVEHFEGHLNKLKEDLTNITRENTNLLENIVQLTESRQGLEEALNSSQSSVTAEYTGLQKKDIVERDKLISLVQTQSLEIEELKKEIEILIQKPMRVLPIIGSSM